MGRSLSMLTQYWGQPGVIRMQSVCSHSIFLMICPICLNCPLTKQNAFVPSSLVQGIRNPSTPADPGAEYLENQRGAFANSF